MNLDMWANIAVIISSVGFSLLTALGGWFWWSLKKNFATKNELSSYVPIEEFEAHKQAINPANFVQVESFEKVADEIRKSLKESQDLSEKRHVKMGERFEEIEHKQTEFATKLSALPSAEQYNKLHSLVMKVEGDVKGVTASLEGIENMISALATQVSMLVENELRSK